MNNNLNSLYVICIFSWIDAKDNVLGCQRSPSIFTHPRANCSTCKAYIHTSSARCWAPYRKDTYSRLLSPIWSALFQNKTIYQPLDYDTKYIPVLCFSAGDPKRLMPPPEGFCPVSETTTLSLVLARAMHLPWIMLSFSLSWHYVKCWTLWYINIHQHLDTPQINDIILLL